MFTSSREQRLWGWALATVVAIYATLGLAGRWAALLPEDVVGLLFGTGFLIALLTVGMSGWLSGRGRSEAWVRTGVALAYGMVLVRMGTSGAERTHLFEYGVVALLIQEALMERRRSGRPVALPSLAAAVTAAGLGWVDELLQGYVAGRTYDLRDVAFNAGAAVMAVSARQAVAWGRARDRG